MKDGIIWDDMDGSRLAWIEGGKVFREADGRQIGTFDEGNIHRMDGTLFGHVEVLGGVTKGAIPEDFRKLAKGGD